MTQLPFVSIDMFSEPQSGHIDTFGGPQSGHIDTFSVAFSMRIVFEAEILHTYFIPRVFLVQKAKMLNLVEYL